MRRVLVPTCIVVLLSGLVAGLTWATVSAEDAPAESTQSRARRQATRVRQLVAGLDPTAHVLEGDHYVAGLDEGRSAELTLVPSLQQHVKAQLERYEVPVASVVALDPRDGRVLAYVSHRQAGEGADVAIDVSPPTASVFKVITGAALIDAGVSPQERVCYGGGASRLRARDIEDDPARDRQCATLTEAMGGSINAVFAKLAVRHLEPSTLERYAQAFGFGHSLPFDVSVPASPTEIPTERLEFARTAAGFWHNHMSPLHGAVIAATIANGGEMVRPSIIERVLDENGNAIHSHHKTVVRQAIPRRTAEITGRMMERTVTHGTARRSFFDQQRRAFLPNIRVAGKTGTLNGSDPYRGYTWWVGFAPADEPTIAVAALVVNEPRWRIKAAYMARETLREYLVAMPRREANAARRAAQAAEAN